MEPIKEDPNSIAKVNQKSSIDMTFAPAMSNSPKMKKKPVDDFKKFGDEKKSVKFATETTKTNAVRVSTMDVDAIGDIDTNRASIVVGGKGGKKEDGFGGIEAMLNSKSTVGKERRTAKLKKRQKKAINMEENGELINSISL